MTKEMGKDADSGEGAMFCPAKAETDMISTVPIWNTVWVMEKIPRIWILSIIFFIREISLRQ